MKDDTLLPMKGYYMQPSGDHLKIKTPYYDMRWNNEKAFNSDKPTGLQVLIDYFGEKQWVNIENSWLGKD